MDSAKRITIDEIETKYGTQICQRAKDMPERTSFAFETGTPDGTQKLRIRRPDRFGFTIAIK